MLKRKTRKKNATVDNVDNKKRIIIYPIFICLSDYKD